MTDKKNNNAARRGRSIFLLTVLFQPGVVFADLAISQPSPYRVFFKYLIWFLFVGDMLVMLFMCILVIWVYMRSTAEAANAAATSQTDAARSLIWTGELS